MINDRCVILFLKALEKGRVKTRLAKFLGEETALELYRCFVEDTLGMLVQGGYPLLIFHDPPAARRHIGQWLGKRHTLLPQTGEDLGDRMQNAFRTTFARGYRAALIVGSDSPDLPNGLLDEALAALGNQDVVLGPARDGGYYLIGFREETFLPDAFTGIAWSTPEVFARTLAILRNVGLRVHLLPTWRDVDTLEDIRALVLRNGDTAFAGSATMNCIRKAQGMEKFTGTVHGDRLVK